MKNIVEKINGSLHYQEMALENLYRGKCFVAVRGEGISKIAKTKRGIEGYIKKNSHSYYCEWSMDMVYPSFDIVEVKETDLVGFNNWNIWYNDLLDCMRKEYLLSGLECYLKYVTDTDLLSYIKSSIEDLKNNEGLGYPDQAAQEKGFKDAKEYHEILRIEEEKKWAEYEAQRQKENEEYEIIRLKREAEENEMNSTNSKVIETDINVFLENVKVSSKPNNIEDILEYNSPENVVISNYLILENNVFELLKNNFMSDFTIIRKLGGSRVFLKDTAQEVDYDKFENMHEIYNEKHLYDFYEDNTLVTNEDNSEFLIINPHGYGYCRYVGILDIKEGTEVLKKLKGEVKVSPFKIIETPETETKKMISNSKRCNQIYLDIEALENRLKMIDNKKLEYKIKSEIEDKTKEIAIIIMSDPLLYAQFKAETK